MENVISYFGYKNKIFYIILNKQNKLEYLIKENNKYRNNFSNEEKTIFSKVLLSLKIDKENVLDLGIKNINNIEINLFYDKEKNLYFTNSTNPLINKEINNRYNNVPDVFFSNGKNQKNNFFKRIVGYTCEFITIFVSSTLILNKIPDIIENKDVYLEAIMSFADTDSNEQPEYSFEKVEDIIQNNENLTEEEKKIILNLDFVFEENHQYMDLNAVYERLSNLRIEYSPTSNEHIAGSYNITKNKILLNESTSIEDTTKTTFVHEFLHVLQTPSNNFLLELSNEFFSRDTIHRLYDQGLIRKEELTNATKQISFGNGYSDYTQLYYLLAEIVPIDTLREFQFSTDPNVLVEGLLKSSNNIDEYIAYDFVTTINDARVYDEEVKGFTLIENSKDTYMACFNDLNYYYNSKTNMDFCDNLSSIVYCFDNNKDIYYDNNYAYKALLDAMVEYGEISTGKIADNAGIIRYVIPKSYFYDNQEKSIFVYNYANDYIEVEVNDNLNSIYQSYYKNYISTISY